MQLAAFPLKYHYKHKVLYNKKKLKGSSGKYCCEIDTILCAALMSFYLTLFRLHSERKADLISFTAC